jgi:hypothetical protein
MAVKSKKNTGLKGYVEGGMVDPQDPLVKKTPPETESIMNDPSLYNAEAFRKHLAKYKNTLDSKGNIIKYGIPFDPKLGGITMSGEAGANRSRLVNSIKSRQEMLDTFMAANKKTSLTAKEANDVLVGANMGTYNDYISQANDYGEYRNLTAIPEQKLKSTVDLLPDSKRYGTDASSPEGTGNLYSWQETIPYDATHAQKMFPKNTYVAPQKKVMGGTVNGKGIKGYIEGGDIQETPLRDAESKKYKTGIKAYAHDYGALLADSALGAFGAGNVVKSEDYDTKLGEKANVGAGYLNAVRGAAITTGLNMLQPGAGSAYQGATGAVSNAVGEDTGISEKNQQGISATGQVAGALGGIAGSLATPKTPTTPDTTATQPKVQTPVTDGSKLTGQAFSDWNQAKPGAEQNAILDKFNAGGYNNLAKGGSISASKAREILHDGTIRGHKITEQQRKFFGAMSNKKADGGKIVGAGTGTSDSIPAKLQDDGFVVPAMNAKIAQELRAKYLGDSKTKIASLNKGGVPVKVSNGEHYFTKEEKAILESKGVDLNKLAPNADSSNELGNGGKVPADIDKEKYAEWYRTQFKPTNAADAGLGDSYDQYRKFQEAQDSQEADANWAAQSKANKEALTSESNVVAKQGVASPATTKTQNPLQRMDVGKGLALAQTGLGIQQLLQDGKRPVDVIDTEFAQTVSEAKADSQFGFTPLQMAIANRGIDKNRAADEQTIINLSGGSAGTALANIRAASIAANDSKNNLTAQSEALRLQKKRYADAKVSEKAGMSKQLFNEKLNAFNVNQEAGAGLVSSGIQNLIGGDRYKTELEAQKKREAMYNPTFNI